MLKPECQIQQEALLQVTVVTWCVLALTPSQRSATLALRLQHATQQVPYTHPASQQIQLSVLGTETLSWRLYSSGVIVTTKLCCARLQISAAVD